MKKTVMVLGTQYTVEKKKYNDDSYFEKNSADGYCDAIKKEIVYCDMSTWPRWNEESEARCIFAEKHTLRHEIIHAFFNESGLQESSGVIDFGWAKNEEMVDWIAIQFPKILEVYRQVNAI